MRRSIAVAVASSLVLGGVTAAVPALAVIQSATTPRATALETSAQKTIVYDGYELQVPASWPVYRLDQHPSTCVRYDVHAVYLGTPGTNMNCPVGLVGRTQTISIIPSTQVAAGSGTEVTYQRSQPDGTGGQLAGRIAAVGSGISANPAEGELRVTAGSGATGATVLATYGDNQPVARGALSSLRRAPSGAANSAQWAPAAPPGSERASLQSAGASALASTQQAAAAAATTFPEVTAFDTCTTPSLAAMRAWRSAYRGIGVYIGGVNRACAFGNLSASWINSTSAMGWRTLPTYVGLQAPCTSFGARINPSTAAKQGRAAAADAVHNAKMFGMGPGSPIYLDMEAYVGGQGCIVAVLTFIGGWVEGLKVAGYKSGVYSSRASGIANMQHAIDTHTRWFAPPNAIWIAHWDGIKGVHDGPLSWPLTERARQYIGPHNQRIGGYTLNIDSDIVAGPMAR